MHSSHNNHNSLWGTTIAASTSTATLPLSIPPAPQLLPGFSQNPLDLLATAGGSLGPVPSTCASSSAATTTPSALSALTTTTTDKHSDAISDDPSARSSLFRDTCMSDSQHHSILPPVEEVDATLCMPSSSQPLDMSFSFGFSQPKEEDEEQATDVFVNSALVAAKEYAKAPINLKDVLDRENELRRMTGIKQIVFDNLRTKYMNMTPSMKDALRHFVIFPRTFNLRAAVAVAGLEETQLVSMQGMLENMIQTNFITTDKGRYELNEAARLFLYEDPTVMEDTMTSGTTDTSQARFIDHYRTQLSRLQDDNIHKVGWLREEAMALYDAERQNMEFSEYLLTGRQAELREFLSAGITVMRYCVSAGNRERVLRKALLEDETSTENIFLSFGDDGAGLDAASSSNASGNDECDKSHKARLHLALSEAYFDQLKTDDAEKPLLEARKLMCDSSPHCRTTASAGVVDRVLVLLLLSNLRLSSRRFKQASAYCVQALRILSEAGLGRSTFAINAMSNLVTTYLEGDSLDKAKSVANRLLDTLNVMRYTGMPIYADALGVCAMVSMAEENYAEAERQYGTALETVGKWGSKEWTGIPVQHCLDLDVWLMEGLAEAIRRQGRTEEALALERRAAEDRRSRGLPPNSTGTEFFDPASGFQDISPSALVMPKLRHLY
ncbi:unnamed protein product [Chondrus crispus]|uniref:Uncharacterized protein n=1 Tax=Chondrus crispus TaxID=2769 RepID=R7QAQ6_CHOCR|nr:unnamed protein product [Chondrus crispus]CDF34535.1 unnamed protein product [Chondrus crispus]|eukprot:XP_005714354.1 unnamed protein product [Chondrus crispus]